MISLARLPGIIGAFAGTVKIGSPFFIELSLRPARPFRASMDKTSPNRCPDACAKTVAASKTSSFKVTVVLMSDTLML